MVLFRKRFSLLGASALLLLSGCTPTDQTMATSEASQVHSSEAKLPALSMERTPLSIHDAARSGDLQALKHAIKGGAGVETRDCPGSTPLHLAASFDHDKAVSHLLASGADKNSRTLAGGHTPLHLAAFLNASRASSVLIRKKSNLNVTDDQGNTALMLASTEGAFEVAKQLLEAGAKKEVRTKNEAGFTALHLAVGSGNTEIVQLLLQHGADRDARTYRGSSAEMIAEQLGHQDILNVLQSYR